MRADPPLPRQAARPKLARLAGRLAVVVVLAGGLFGVIRNIAGNVTHNESPAEPAGNVTGTDVTR